MPQDVWAVADRYESYVGRWSRVVAGEFLAWLAPEPGARWLDLGCGTGALSATVAARCGPARVVGIDPSVPFVRLAHSSVGEAHFAAGDAVALPVRDRTFDHVVSGLMLNFVAEPERAVQEMRRATVDGGTVAGYVWDYADRMQLMRYFWDAAVALDPAAAAFQEGSRFPLCHPDRLAELFAAAGLSTVEVRAIEVPTVFADFDDYWSPFLGGQGPAPAYAVALDEDRRAALRDRLRATLPVAADGSIPLVARAWAVRGYVVLG